MEFYYYIIGILVLFILYKIVKWFNDRECPAGTSKWNSGGLSNISTCKCESGYGWGPSGCQECPRYTDTDNSGGESDIRGCKCLKNYGWNKQYKTCNYCYSNTSPNEKGPPDEPGSGCFCPEGTKWDTNQCRCM